MTATHATTLSKIPILYINLDRAPQRADHMARILSVAGLGNRAERTVAIDGRTDVLRDGYRPSFWSHQWRMDRVEMACLESHRRVWQRIVELDVMQAVVLEDDVLLAPGFKDAVENIIAGAPDFDCIKLDGVPLTVRLGPPVSCGPVSIRPLMQRLFSSAGYLVSRRGAARLIAETNDFRDPIDLLTFVVRPGWKMFQADPAVCAQGMLLSGPDRKKLPQEGASSDRLEGGHWGNVLDRGPWWFRLKGWVGRTAEYTANRFWQNRALLRKGGKIGLLDGFVKYR